MKQWTIQTLAPISSDHKNSKKSYVSVGSRMHWAEKSTRHTQAPSQPSSAEYKVMIRQFSLKLLSELWKMLVHIFVLDLGWQLSDFVKTVLPELARGITGYNWLLVWIIHRFPQQETVMLFIEAVWTMPSVTGCHTLSKPIDDDIPKTLDGKNLAMVFHHEFHWSKMKGKNNQLHENDAKKSSWLLTNR